MAAVTAANSCSWWAAVTRRTPCPGSARASIRRPTEQQPPRSAELPNRDERLVKRQERVSSSGIRSDPVHRIATTLAQSWPNDRVWGRSRSRAGHRDPQEPSGLGPEGIADRERRPAGEVEDRRIDVVVRHRRELERQRGAVSPRGNTRTASGTVAPRRRRSPRARPACRRSSVPATSRYASRPATRTPPSTKTRVVGSRPWSRPRNMSSSIRRSSGNSPVRMPAGASRVAVREPKSHAHAPSWPTYTPCSEFGSTTEMRAPNGERHSRMVWSPRRNPTAPPSNSRRRRRRPGRPRSRCSRRSPLTSGSRRARHRRRRQPVGRDRREVDVVDRAARTATTAPTTTTTATPAATHRLFIGELL